MNNRWNNKIFLGTTYRCLTITVVRSAPTYTTKKMQILILVWWLSHCIINNRLCTKTTKYSIMPHWWRHHLMKTLDTTIQMVLGHLLRQKRCLALVSRFTNILTTWCFLSNLLDHSHSSQMDQRITAVINSIQITYFKCRKLPLNRQSNHSPCSRSQLNHQNQRSTSF